MIVLLFLMVCIFGWAVWQTVHILDDRISFRKERAQLEAALQASQARSDNFEKELKQVRSRQEQNAFYLERLHKQVKTYQRMIYGEMHQKSKNRSESAKFTQGSDD